MVSNAFSFQSRFQAGCTQVFCLSVPDNFSKFEFPLALAKNVLTPTEIDRYCRYRVQNRRNDILISRILFQIILKKLGVSPAESFWIEADSNGKPFAHSKKSQAPFHLNTSDTTGMIVWAFNKHHVLGCDVESMSKDQEEIAKRHFAPVEVAGYQASTGLNKKHRFYEIWTMKEAVIKADGRGLTIPLDSFYFQFDQDQPVFHLMDKKKGPPAGPWQTHSFRPDDSHQVGVAVVSSQPVEFDCHHLSLTSLDSDWVRPWSFHLDFKEGKKDISSVFAVFDPAAKPSGSGDQFHD